MVDNKESHLALDPWDSLVRTILGWTVGLMLLLKRMMDYWNTQVWHSWLYHTSQREDQLMLLGLLIFSTFTWPPLHHNHHVIQPRRGGGGGVTLCIFEQSRLLGRLKKGYTFGILLIYSRWVHCANLYKLHVIKTQDILCSSRLKKKWCKT